MTRIVILGAGTAGTITANRLRRRFARSIRAGRARITIVDQDDRHVYQPGLLFVPFGIYTPEGLIRDRQKQLHRDVTYVRGHIDRVVTGENRVYFSDRSVIDYDVLIIATGSRLVPEETDGMMGAGWRTSVFDFYSMDGAMALRDKLATWPGGRLVIDVVEMPIKCPVAPLEFAFLADWYFRKRGMRDKVDITYVTPLDGAFTKPIVSAELSHLLEEKHINLVTEYSAGRVDGAAGVLYSWDEREIPFDLLVTVPLHCGAEFVGRSPGLGDDIGFVLTNPQTLQSLVVESVFAIGDATNIPTSKAGSVAHFEADILVRNIERFLAGRPLVEEFDGHANCFVETGFDKALLIDFNYDVEPLQGSFPLPGLGPLQLLRESRLNHYGKLAFQWIYWHVLLPGHDIPGIGSTMTMRGKDTTPKPPSATSPADTREHSGAGSAL
jgi:sulfide:quinone oxidoreductase